MASKPGEACPVAVYVVFVCVCLALLVISVNLFSSCKSCSSLIRIVCNLFALLFLVITFITIAFNVMLGCEGIGPTDEL
eukprot:m.138810 g.138810  ORF g.138810 m.138810 type:complete len:79 (-) comp14783_c0_seq2:2042-2278(-)